MPAPTMCILCLLLSSCHPIALIIHITPSSLPFPSCEPLLNNLFLLLYPIPESRCQKSILPQFYRIKHIYHTMVSKHQTLPHFHLTLSSQVNFDHLEHLERQNEGRSNFVLCLKKNVTSGSSSSQIGIVRLEKLH